MAGDWMKVELELPDKPEVHAIAGMLGLDSDMVVGKLFRVWQWFDKHTTDGNAFGVTYALLDRITSVSGFGEAMMFVGWLEQNDKILTMPKFDRHTSKSAKKRALTGSRVKNFRSDTPENCNAQSVTKALPEKRREEKNNKDISFSVRFDEFWSTYPATSRRTAKSQCLEKWQKRNLDLQADQIIAHVKAMKETDSWREGFEPATLTYINQSRWEGFEDESQKHVGELFPIMRDGQKVMVTHAEYVEFKNKTMRIDG